jgi:lactate dehydrogenase-like 2-hydroxyacid dehydrogenase
MNPEVLLTKPIYAPVLAQLEQEFTVRKLWTAADQAAYLQQECGGVRAIVTVGAVGLRQGVIESLPRLELIACFGTPHGTVDLAAAAKRGIPVTNTPDTIFGTVAELAAGMTVAIMRKIVEEDRFVRSGRWVGNAPPPGSTLIGKTCGIVGLGRIGRETATRLAAFGMEIEYHGPREKAGVRYRYHADLVALARGAIVDEAALIAALKEKRIAGAALDVFWDEPRVPAALMDLDNVVLLPHVGSTTKEIREERGRKLMANLHAHFAGKPVPNPL